MEACPKKGEVKINDGERLVNKFNGSLFPFPDMLAIGDTCSIDKRETSHEQDRQDCQERTCICKG